MRSFSRLGQSSGQSDLAINAIAYAWRCSAVALDQRTARTHTCYADLLLSYSKPLEHYLPDGMTYFSRGNGLLELIRQGEPVGVNIFL